MGADNVDLFHTTWNDVVYGISHETEADGLLTLQYVFIVKIACEYLV